MQRLCFQKCEKNPRMASRPCFEGVLSSKHFVGLLFLINIAVFTASAYRDCGNLDCCSIHLVISTIVLFARSATPFCCGVYFTDNYLAMPSSSRNFFNSLDKYSFSLFVRNFLIRLFDFPLVFYNS